MLSAARAEGAAGVIYQPLNRDLALSDADWRSLISRLPAEGIGYGLVQWTRFGDEQFTAQEHWLSNRISWWGQQMPLWLGLYADPEYFTRIHQSPENQAPYLRRYLQRNSAQLQQLLQSQRAQSIKLLGFYLPMELSDYDFPTPAHRKMLLQELTKWRAQIDFPVAISIYLNGSISADEFRDWITELETIDFQVFYQDGRGTGLLDPALQRRYREALPNSALLIVEAFEQIESAPFRAEKVGKSQWSEIKKESKQYAQPYFFSLRYLPFNTELPLTD